MIMKSGDEAEIDYEGMSQGTLGDCYFMTVLFLLS